MADLVFVVTLARVLNVVDSRMSELELIDYLEPKPAVEMFDLDADDAPLRMQILAPAWVDDYSVPIFAPAGLLVSKCKAAFICVWQVFHQYKLELNMRPGKTACLPFIYGPGAVAAQHQFANLGGSLWCDVGGERVCLNIVKAYKHMGVRTVASGTTL